MPQIDPVDAVVYILAQLSGGVLGALLAKGILLDEGRAGHYGAAVISPLLGSNFLGFVVEGIGTFVLVLVVLSVLFNHAFARSGDRSRSASRWPSCWSWSSAP